MIEKAARTRLLHYEHLTCADLPAPRLPMGTPH